MAQFTAAGLARLLANVEREVLVEALELAGMTQLLTSTALSTLEDLQFRLNQLQNLETFGPALFRAKRSDFIDEVLKILPMFIRIPAHMVLIVEFLLTSIQEQIASLSEVQVVVTPAQRTRMQKLVSEVMLHNGHIIQLSGKPIAVSALLNETTRIDENASALGAEIASLP